MFYSIKNILRIYNEQSEQYKNFLIKENINLEYFSLLETVIKRLTSVDEEYINYRFETELEERKKFIKKNNSFDANNNVIENLKILLQKTHKNLLNSKFKLIDGEEISINDFLNNYAKYVLIDGKIILKDVGEVSLQQFISYICNLQGIMFSIEETQEK